VQDLEDEAKALHLTKGVESSLMAMLDDAGIALSADQTSDAILALEDFIKHVDVQILKKISEESAADLQEFAGEIEDLLRGSPATTGSK
jgi:FIMAH domain-containing protein